MTRTPLIAGNWKMNLTYPEAVESITALAEGLTDAVTSAVDIAIIAPFTSLRSIQELNERSPLPLTYGAQDISEHDSGAYTGEVSGPMLQALGCTWVVVGHSERRGYHSETDATVATKAAQALKFGMKPIVCVGEPLEIREAGTHVEHVVAQVKGSLAGLSHDDLQRTVIAYEPIWAIGTGKVASASDAQEVCHAIRGAVRDLAGDDIADGMRILYGGSVKTETVAELVAQDDVDGGLVGGASLKGADFAALATAAAQ